MLPSQDRREWLWASALSVLIVLLASLAYVVAWEVTPPGHHFTGVLINPLDGLSYLAKMGQGSAGSWQFRLPYTAEPHTPVLLFTYHLALGHLAPSGSPHSLALVYHLARVVCGWGLLMAVYWATGWVTTEPSKRRWALGLVGLSGGIGWLAGGGTDLLVPESITFSSIMVNAHFGLTSLLMLALVMGATLAVPTRRHGVLALCGGALLASIQPLAAPVVLAVVGTWHAVNWLHGRSAANGGQDRLGSRSSVCRRLKLEPNLTVMILCGAGAVPLLAYGLALSHYHPLIHRWMEQNVTPSPPIGEWLVGYGLLVPLAVLGGLLALKKGNRAGKLWLLWCLVQASMIFLPIALQRRLSTGLHLPIALLAAQGFWSGIYGRLGRTARRWVPAVLLVLVLPSNVLLALAGVSAAQNRHPGVVLSDAQWRTMEWLRTNASAATVVLADAELGAAVPALGGGARVVYGHPFETPEAEETYADVESFYTGRMGLGQADGFLEHYAVELVLVQTDRYPAPSLPVAVYPIFQTGPVVVYRRGP